MNGRGEPAARRTCHRAARSTLYVDDDDAYLQFASDAGLRRLFVPDLAEKMNRYFARSKAGEQVGAACLLSEPIVSSTADYKVIGVKVAVPNPRAATPDRTAGTVSLRNFGRPAVVRIDLHRTPDGWRMDDLRAGTKPSLRAQMAPCAAGGQ